MAEIMNEFTGKLYEKAEIEKWDLPEKIKEQIGLKDNSYFFLTSCREEKHGMRHVHFSIYPTKYEMVYFILVKLPEINPKILSNVLTYLKKSNYDIFNSTGFCIQENTCFFGIYFSFSEDLKKGEIIRDMSEFENVQEVKIFKFSCIGCAED
jgi:hypothetical protein